jgi:hypothetical protein
MYLPVLTAGESPRLTQSITLTGESVNASTTNDVSSISVSVDFPKGPSGDFDSVFFNFPDNDFPYDDNSEELDIPAIVPNPDDGYQDVVLELYLSEVSVGFGVN